MEERSYSIAEAKDGLAKLVHQAEERAPVVITRRGRPVAVLVSFDQYERHLEQRSFSEALKRFYEAQEAMTEGIDDVFENLRDPSPGRDPLI